MIEIREINNHILWATINRPKALNAVNFEVMADLERLAERIENDENIRVLVLTGAGNKTFVSGGDLREFHTITDREKAAEMSAKMQQILNRLEQLPCWTIAFVNGDAYGGGTELMLAMDFRLAVPNIKLGFTQGRFYLIPGWGGLTRLIEQVGRSTAMNWLAKAEIISTGEALEAKLLDGVIPGKEPQDEIVEWAEKLTRNDRFYIKSLKSAANYGNELRINAMKHEIKAFTDLWVSEEHINRIDAFLNRRK